MFSITSGQMPHHFMSIWEGQNKGFWLKNGGKSKFFKVAGSVRKVIIWPEMGTWGAVDTFCTDIRYLNMFWANLGKFEKNRFLKFWIKNFQQIWPKISNFRPIIGQITLGLGRIPLKLFPNKMPLNRSVLLLRYKVICKKSTFSPNQCNVHIIA